MVAKSGMLESTIREKWMFMVGSQFMRFRHGMRPFKKFELHSDLAHISEDKVRQSREHSETNVTLS